MSPCHPSSPCSRPIFIHWLTAPCVTPNASAMSFWLHPCSESSHARRRRHSFQSPRCSSVFLMPPVYHTLATHVEVSIEDISIFDIQTNQLLPYLLRLFIILIFVKGFYLG